MTVYLCGGINGLSDSDCRDWREVAKSLLRADTLDPMRRDYRGREDEHVTDIVLLDIVDIEKSHVLLVNATKPSWGTAMELFYCAHVLAKPVIAWVGHGRVSPWLRYFSSECHESLEMACAAINARGDAAAEERAGDPDITVGV